MPIANRFWSLESSSSSSSSSFFFFFFPQTFRRHTAGMNSDLSSKIEQKKKKKNIFDAKFDDDLFYKE